MAHSRAAALLVALLLVAAGSGSLARREREEREGQREHQGKRQKPPVQQTTTPEQELEFERALATWEARRVADTGGSRADPGPPYTVNNFTCPANIIYVNTTSTFGTEVAGTDLGMAAPAPLAPGWAPQFCLWPAQPLTAVPCRAPPRPPHTPAGAFISAYVSGTAPNNVANKTFVLAPGEYTVNDNVRIRDANAGDLCVIGIGTTPGDVRIVADPANYDQAMFSFRCVTKSFSSGFKVRGNSPETPATCACRTGPSGSRALTAVLTQNLAAFGANATARWNFLEAQPGATTANGGNYTDAYIENVVVQDFFSDAPGVGVYSQYLSIIKDSIFRNNVVASDNNHGGELKAVCRQWVSFPGCRRGMPWSVLIAQH
jgi:hypothetical protein